MRSNIFQVGIVYPANTAGRRYSMKELRARKAVSIKEGTLIVAVDVKSHVHI